MRIQRSDGSVITFKYDAFGRRIEKKTVRATTHFVWDGNVPLHEWKTFDYRETTDNDRITWIFQDFVPVAKLQGGKSYSIISDHIGTPLVAIDNEGVKVWERELDIYGKVRKETKETPNFVPFRYQGQYYDSEVDLCYNRFRYYDCNTGSYISQDPIGLAGGNPTLYGYVFDNNVEVDIFGLSPTNPFDIVPYKPSNSPLENHHGILDVWATNNIEGYKSRASHNPTVALTKEQHDATKAVYRDWLREKTGKSVGGKVDWTKVSAKEAQQLAERMFDAAKVPQHTRDEYYRKFNQYIYSGCKG